MVWREGTRVDGGSVRCHTYIATAKEAPIIKEEEEGTFVCALKIATGDHKYVLRASAV